jgi:hypothetical protein
MKVKSVRKLKKATLPPLLQKRQRNAIVEAIQAVSLEPREFDLDDSGTEALIKHRRSESFFLRRGGKRPGSQIGVLHPNSSQSFNCALEACARWHTKARSR